MADTQKQTTFLIAYAECGQIKLAAQAAGCHPKTHYYWLREDPEYPRQFEDAQLEAADVLETEARRRAVEGVRRYKFNRNGEPIKHPETGEPYFEHVYSDQLLVTLLKANNPAKFGDKVETTHKGKSPVRIYQLPDNGRSVVHIPDNGRGGHPDSDSEE